MGPSLSWVAARALGLFIFLAVLAETRQAILRLAPASLQRSLRRLVHSPDRDVRGQGTSARVNGFLAQPDENVVTGTTTLTPACPPSDLWPCWGVSRWTRRLPHHSEEFIVHTYIQLRTYVSNCCYPGLPCELSTFSSFVNARKKRCTDM